MVGSLNSEQLVEFQTGDTKVEVTKCSAAGLWFGGPPSLRNTLVASTLEAVIPLVLPLDSQTAWRQGGSPSSGSLLLNSLQLGSSKHMQLAPESYRLLEFTQRTRWSIRRGTLQLDPAPAGPFPVPAHAGLRRQNLPTR